MKVSQMPYTRVDKEKFIGQIKELTKQFSEVQNVETQLEISKKFDDLMDENLTNFQLAYIRFTQNTKDEFYQKENDFWDETLPEVNFFVTEFKKGYVNSKFSDELRKHFPPVFFKNIELDMQSSDERIITLEVEVSKKVTEYTKINSNILVDFNGEKLPPSGMSKYATNPDRELRKGAFLALGAAYMEHAEDFDRIYDDMVKLRTQMGRTLGYEGFSPLGYANMKRNCYGKEDIAKFRENVKKYIVPLAGKIKDKVKKNLEIDQIMFYDERVFTVKEPKPIGTPEQIFDNGSKMYHEMSEVTGKLFDKMREIEAFDPLSREGKWGGGYCISIDKYRTPFILANFNGSLGDIDVLTHEFGHALAFDRAFELPFAQLREPSMETAEVHSMSMEFLAYPWLKMFFGERTEDYKFNHIGSALTFIPYGTIVDYFQQTCYDNPDMTPAERNAFWAKIEKEFLPHMSAEGMPFYGDGRRWQRQAHIFEVPFYYIDYCLAQFTALQFLALSDRDYKKAQEVYMAFLVQAGTKPFTELVASAGLKSPFEEESFKDIVAVVEKMLNV